MAPASKKTWINVYLPRKQVQMMKAAGEESGLEVSDILAVAVDNWFRQRNSLGDLAKCALCMSAATDALFADVKPKSKFEELHDKFTALTKEEVETLKEHDAMGFAEARLRNEKEAAFEMAIAEFLENYNKD